ncbi:DUF6375 family protein [Micromonospora parva]|uniref:DUF6375 family protein n=1 Tax=Micromonospora parva TaxID=1464048 RepID=UPI0037ACB9D5
MKIWAGYGSEHSMNLVMIGHFATAGEAEAVKQAIEEMETVAHLEMEAGRLVVGEPARRFPEALSNVIRALHLYSLGPTDLQQFCYDVTTKQHDKTVIIRTDEIEVSAYMKVLLDKGARIEVFSGHDFPDQARSL